MTKTIQVTRLEEIQSVRVICGSCGADFSIPVKRQSDAFFHDCHACGAAIPTKPICEALSVIARLQELQTKHSFKVVIETDPAN